MKIIKVLSASAIAAAIAASITVPASAATTYEDAVEAAKECGVQAHNVQQLENFLEAHADRFTSDEYDDMIADLENIRDTYVIPAAEELGYDTTDLASLSEEDKVKIGAKWSEEDKRAIQDDLIDLGAKYDVTVTITMASKDHYDVTAVMNDENSSNSSNASSSSATDSTKKDSAVSPTGGQLESGSNATAIAFGGIATLLAATGIIVVAKKNKD